MCNKQFYCVGNYNIELIVPDNNKDLKYSSDNNINAFNEKGEFLWNISELLIEYSVKKGLKYFNEMFFEIKVLDDGNIFCIGFYNHCEVNLHCRCITRIINNR